MLGKILSVVRISAIVGGGTDITRKEHTNTTSRDCLFQRNGRCTIKLKGGMKENADNYYDYEWLISLGTSVSSVALVIGGLYKSIMLMAEEIKKLRSYSRELLKNTMNTFYQIIQKTTNYYVQIAIR